MSPFVAVLALHVVLAVLGAGGVVSIAVVARAARLGSPEAAAPLPALMRVVSAGLGGVLITGVALDGLAGGAFHERWWLRGSALLLVATGASIGLARRGLRADPLGGLARVEWLAYGACVFVGAVAVLMVVQP